MDTSSLSIHQQKWKWSIQMQEVTLIITIKLVLFNPFIKYSKSINSCPLTGIRMITLLLWLEISIWVTLKCHKRCKGVFLCKLLIVRGSLEAHVHLVQMARAFSVIWHTQRHCNGPKTFKNGWKFIFWIFWRGCRCTCCTPWIRHCFIVVCFNFSLTILTRWKLWAGAGQEHQGPLLAEKHIDDPFLAF